MNDMIALSRSSDVKQAMLLGLGKSPLQDAHPLATLSLVAMRGKFARTPRPAGSGDPDVSYGPSAKYLSDDSRALLVRLLSGKEASASDGIARATLRAIRSSGLQLHPFDYARLEGFIAQHAADLGPEERDWLKVIRPERKQDDALYIDGPLTEETFPQAGKAQKREFLRELRARDGARARALLEQFMPGEPANVRAELVGLLALQLDESDRPFLESLLQDRAQSVRDAATELLGRIRGTDAFAKRIARLKDHVTIKTAGLLTRHKVLKFTAPVTKQPRYLGDEDVGARDLLGGLRLKDISDALGETEASLLEAASRTEKAGMLPFLLLVQAARDGLIDLAIKYQSIHDGDNAQHTIAFLREVLPAVEGATRDRVLRIALRPKDWRTSPHPFLVEQMAACIDAALPADLAGEILDLPFWSAKEVAGRPEHAELLVNAVAPLVPRPLSERFIAISEPVSRRATLYHRFLLSLPN